jgi:hypothetical protein
MAVGPWLAGRLQDAWATPAAALVAAALLLAVTVPLSVIFAVMAMQRRPAERNAAGRLSPERAANIAAAA